MIPTYHLPLSYDSQKELMTSRPCYVHLWRLSRLSRCREKIFAKKKDVLAENVFFNPILFRLCSTGGAYSGAGAAVDACIFVDGIDVAFGNAVNGTFGFACATSDAVAGNFMCHNDTSMNYSGMCSVRIPKLNKFAFWNHHIITAMYFKV